MGSVSAGEPDPAKDLPVTDASHVFLGLNFYNAILPLVFKEPQFKMKTLPYVSWGAPCPCTQCGMLLLFVCLLDIQNPAAVTPFSP